MKRFIFPLAISTIVLAVAPLWAMESEQANSTPPLRLVLLPLMSPLLNKIYRKFPIDETRVLAMMAA